MSMPTTVSSLDVVRSVIRTYSSVAIRAPMYPMRERLAAIASVTLASHTDG